MPKYILSLESLISILFFHPPCVVFPPSSSPPIPLRSPSDPHLRLTTHKPILINNHGTTRLWPFTARGRSERPLSERLRATRYQLIVVISDRGNGEGLSGSTQDLTPRPAAFTAVRSKCFNSPAGQERGP